jgi:hypothetical protein
MRKFICNTCNVGKPCVFKCDSDFLDPKYCPDGSYLCSWQEVETLGSRLVRVQRSLSRRNYYTAIERKHYQVEAGGIISYVSYISGPDGETGSHIEHKSTKEAIERLESFLKSLEGGQYGKHV